jgi:hypothetical protein
VTRRDLEALSPARADGSRIAYAADPTLRTLLLVATPLGFPFGLPVERVTGIQPA